MIYSYNKTIEMH